MNIEKKPFRLGRFQVLVHVGLFRMVQFLLASSLGCLAAALSAIVLRVNRFTSLAPAVTIRVLLDAVFTTN
ncbi:uncharacterized protein BJ212DRAFT_1395226 [Suillus subaureus]|uniref:Uncharacterized protein n=1 Tax=Suillus subaureus TaxID=48587 RepID=A0A9P7DV62_9AGAM|nr:uncharacterized protein BJ212DRAFT_1395226 [Suillus subaureus]KAG1803952.1 hypothetical protein BJ212DRAFT_1395226 [Suillus subaureus]